MKNYVVLLLMMMMSYFCFSQQLTPKVVQLGKKKYFCFTSYQAKELAKLLEIGNYNDSLVSSLSKQNEQLRFLVDRKDRMIVTKKEQLQNFGVILQNKNEVILDLGKTIKGKDKKIERGKFQKILLSGSLIAITTLLISK